MRRALIAATCAIFATSCAAVLGLRDIEREEPSGPATGEDAGGDAKAEASAVDPADAGSIDCFGSTRKAYFCDDFEAAALSSSWTRETTDGGDGSFDVTTKPDQKLPGSTQTGVSDIPGGASAVGTQSARVRWQRPDKGRRLAFQFRVFLDHDAWDKGTTVPFASVFDGTKEGKIVFTADGNGSNGSLSLQIGSQSVDLGSVVEKAWICIELATDGTRIRATLDGTEKGSLTDLSGLTEVSLGMVTDARGKDFYYDNVIVAPDPIGCQ